MSSRRPVPLRVWSEPHARAYLLRTAADLVQDECFLVEAHRLVSLAMSPVVCDEEAGRAFVVFRLSDRSVRLNVPLPKLGDRAFERDGRGTRRTEPKKREAWEQSCRERWRLLVLLVKSKLEAVAAGVTTIEREFLADVFLPDGRTVHEALVDPIREAYADGKVRPLMLGPAQP